MPELRPEADAFFDRVWTTAAEVARRYVDPDDADDLASEVTLRLWRAREQYAEAMQSREALERLTIVVTKRMFLNLVRERRRRSTREASASAPMLRIVDESPSQLVADELAAVANRVLDALPSRTREAWRLVHDEGKSHAEAAVRMGIAKQTVNVHVCTALRALRIAIDRYRLDGAFTTREDIA